MHFHIGPVQGFKGGVPVRINSSAPARIMTSVRIRSHFRWCFALWLTLTLPGSGSLAHAVQEQQEPTQKAQVPDTADAAFRSGYAAVQRNDLVTAEAEFAKVVQLSPQVAAGHSAYGSVLLSAGKLQPAIAELKEAHRLDPAEPTATLNLARAYQQAGEDGNALKILEAAATQSSGMSPESYFLLAQLLLAGDDLEKAYTRMEEAVGAYPQSAEMEDTLGVVLARQTRYPEAEIHFRKALQLDESFDRAHLHLGAALMAEKRPLEAKAELELAASRIPNDAEIQLQLGRALTQTGDDEAALQAARRAVALDPASIEAKYALAVALQNHGEDKEAVGLFREAAAARPDDAPTLINLGLALVQTGNAKEAIPYYMRALALNPGSWILQQDLGVAYLQQSDLDHAIEHFKAGIAIDPHNAQLHYDIGLAYKLQDKMQEAIDAFETAETEDESLADPPYTLGVLYMQTGKFEEAQTQLKKAVALRPENGDAWSVLGNVDRSLNQEQQAIGDLQKAIALQPEQPGNHVTLAAMYAHQGRHNDAVAERKIAADLSRAAVNKQKAGFAVGAAQTLMNQGHVDEAIAQLQQALSADPGNTAAHEAMADALMRKGRPADAAIERQKATAALNR